MTTTKVFIVLIGFTLISFSLTVLGFVAGVTITQNSYLAAKTEPAIQSDIGGENKAYKHGKWCIDGRVF